MEHTNIIRKVSNKLLQKLISKVGQNRFEGRQPGSDKEARKEVLSGRNTNLISHSLVGAKKAMSLGSIKHTPASLASTSQLAPTTESMASAAPAPAPTSAAAASDRNGKIKCPRIRCDSVQRFRDNRKCNISLDKMISNLGYRIVVNDDGREVQDIVAFVVEAVGLVGFDAPAP